MMYAKLCNLEILSSYVKEVSVGDLLTVEALVTNPLDWQHFYDKVSSIKKGDRTDFMVVTAEGDRLQGTGDISEVEKWSNHGQYGFKIKVMIKKQKSLTDRRTRVQRKADLPVPERNAIAVKKPHVQIAPVAAQLLTDKDMIDFKEMLRGSLAMDIK